MRTKIKENVKVSNSGVRRGGPKTPQGKDMSKQNSLKHGILSNATTVYDGIKLDSILARLSDELAPKTSIEELLVERIALYILRLQRVVKAETEHMKKCLDPTITESILEQSLIAPRITRQGYSQKIKQEDIEPLLNIYHRYEKSLENRLYRVIQELKRIQKKQGD